jgi:di/tricarboxylate transporter
LVSADAWFTLAVVLLTLGLLASERFSAPLVVVGAVTVLLVGDVVDTDQALAGFSNEAVITIAALYVLAGAAEATGVLDRITSRTLGSAVAPRDRRRATSAELVRVLAPSAIASTLIYNTPLIGMVAPQVSAWARRTRRSPSWYLMALNAAVLLGGAATAIGTTTNVVMSGLLTNSGRAPLDLFEITPVGAPIAIAGVALLVALAPRLVPDRHASSEDVAARPFTLEMVVTPGSPLAGKTIAQAGLRNLEGVYLVELHDEARTVAPVAPDRVLREGARLVFAGNVDRIVDLQRIPGLVPAAEQHFSVVDHDPGRQFFEVVVGPGSALAGTTLKEIGFRARFEAAVLAIHRADTRVGAKLGDVVLHPGDVLLVLGAADFAARWRDRGEFLAVAPLEGVPPLRRDKAVVVGVVLSAFVLVAATGVLSVLEAALLAALAVVVFRVISPGDARRAVNLDVVVVLAASFGLGNAIAASGLASELATLLIDVFGGLGDVGVLAGVVISTVVLTQLVTNNATAVVMFPIALATATEAGLDVRPFAIAVAVAASMSFLTPIGYQTNMIVYGMGGYRFWDFARVGLPLVIVTIGVTLVATPIAFPLR